MKKLGGIKFEVLSTDYDLEKVKDGFDAYCKKDQYYLPDLAERFPNLITHYKDKEQEQKSFGADILIIEDDIICITKYCKLIELYIEKYERPPIHNVIACTKAESVHYVLDQLAHPKNENSKPKLIILDFDLQEKKDSAKSIFEIVDRIEGFDWYPEYLAVSGFKSMKGDFESFEALLRNKHHLTFEKERLDDHKLMLDVFEFLLDRTENYKDKEGGIGKLHSLSNEKYLKLEHKVGKKKLESTVLFLDGLEKGIKGSCKKQEKLNPERHKIKNMKGNFYSRSSLAQQIRERYEIINKLLILSHHTPFILNRWKYFEYQVCHHRFSKKYLKCPSPKDFLFPKENK